MFVEQNSFNLAVRFLIILILLLTAFFIPKKKAFVHIFILLGLTHSILLILFEGYIVFFSDPTFPSYIRGRVLELGVGDIYSYNGYFYRIQIKGNAILPIAFLISLYAINTKWLKYTISITLFIGTLIAGNFAFLIALAAFFLYHLFIFMWEKYKSNQFRIKKFLFKNTTRKLITTILTLLLLLVTVIPVFLYSSEVIKRKLEYSIPTRFDQVFVLLDDMSENPLTIALGKGLGNTVSVETEYRNYTGDIYFELQSIYILNQVGVIYMILFVLTNLVFAIYFWSNRKVYLIYLSYLVYALTNPYIFDSMNILVIVVLGSLVKILEEEGINNV
ncbi:hypothetical protein ACFSYB_00200 [Litchfieldia salsa]